MEYQNKTLVCKECAAEFIWTSGEQEFFHSKGLKHKPTRCKDCRKKNRQRVEAEYYKVYCDSCGQIGETLTQPTETGATIYCRSCFEKNILHQS